MSEMERILNRFKSCQKSCNKRRQEYLDIAAFAADKGDETLYYKAESGFHKETAEYNRLQGLIDKYEDDD